MPRTTSFTLGEYFEDFLTRQVDGGKYGSASDVMRAALRLLEEHETKLRALRKAIVEGEDSGPAETYDLDAIKLAARRRAAEER